MTQEFKLMDNVGDEFVFYCDDKRDAFWHICLDTLAKTNANPVTIAQYIYTSLHRGSIMKDWMKDENMMKS